MSSFWMNGIVAREIDTANWLRGDRAMVVLMLVAQSNGGGRRKRGPDDRCTR